MTSNEITPIKHHGSGGGWFIAFVVLAVIGAAVVLPAFALVLAGIVKLAFGIVGGAIGIVLGLLGAVIGVVIAVVASVFAVFAVIFGLAFAALPLILLVALLVGLGVLLGRSAHHG